MQSIQPRKKPVSILINPDQILTAEIGQNIAGTIQIQKFNGHQRSGGEGIVGAQHQLINPELVQNGE